MFDISKLIEDPWLVLCDFYLKTMEWNVVYSEALNRSQSSLLLISFCIQELWFICMWEHNSFFNRITWNGTTCFALHNLMTNTVHNVFFPILSHLHYLIGRLSFSLPKLKFLHHTYIHTYIPINPDRLAWGAGIKDMWIRTVRLAVGWDTPLLCRCRWWSHLGTG